MVVVCSNAAYFQKSYFRAEWNAFYNSKLNHRKKEDAPLIVVLINMEQSQVPPPLHMCECVECAGEHDLNNTIRLIETLLRKAKGLKP